MAGTSIPLAQRTTTTTARSPIARITVRVTVNALKIMRPQSGHLHALLGMSTSQAGQVWVTVAVERLPRRLPSGEIGEITY